MQWLPRVSCAGLCKYTMMMGGGCGAIPVLVLMAAAWRLSDVVVSLKWAEHQLEGRDVPCRMLQCCTAFCSCSTFSCLAW